MLRSSRTSELGHEGALKMDIGTQNDRGTKGDADQVNVVAEFLEHLAERIGNCEKRECCLIEAGRLRALAADIRKQIANPGEKYTSAA